MTNKTPLPLHLLVRIKGFALLGQTSFGGYCKIIWAWWLNGCPEVFSHQDEWLSLSGMRTSDYSRYKSKMEPVLSKSFEILSEYNATRKEMTEHRRVNLRKALKVRMDNVAEKKKRLKPKGSLVDSNVGVNPTAISVPYAFHEGWNLNKKSDIVVTKKPTSKGILVDK